MTTETKTKPYRVTVHFAVEVEVEVDADSVEEAKAKAYEWGGGRGWQKVGDYTIYHDDDTETDRYDANEMFWHTPNWEFEQFGDVLELEEEDEEEEENNHVTKTG